LTIWGIHWGGSDGAKGVIILDKVGENMIPVAGLRSSIDDTSHFYILDKIKNNKVEFATTRASDFTKVADINQDGVSELLFGSYKWEQDEGHYGDHIWDLEVYELSEKGSAIPAWWNEGKSYTTTQKFGFGEDEEAKLYSEFASKVKKN
jgi:hypothetical protein